MEPNLEKQRTSGSRQNPGLKMLIVLLKTFKPQNRFKANQKRGRIFKIIHLRNNYRIYFCDNFFSYENN
jgi:hypothetical protein